ncbi:Hypothetical protein EIN_123250, partial [Entamoeba invadens IP1]
LFVHYLQFAMS